MNAVEKLIKRHEIGQAIFEQLFQLNDNELREKLISITNNKYNKILERNSSCVRTICDSEPEKIEFYFYDGLRVDWQGITIIPEHGGEYLIIEFNEHFCI